jgi:hypothetical protein
MRLERCALLISLCFFCGASYAQIYTCTAEDGTRVFSDERCGPDAKIVPGITTKKKSTGGANKTKRVPKTPAELEELIAQCNAGEMRACNEWTHGGGPSYLREQEQQAGAACEAGSLPDCEQRYCVDGITDECRTRVFAAAKISGNTWYLRAQHAQEDGATQYEVRCAKQGVREIREAMVTCSGPPGPNRCVLGNTEKGFARLDQAAASYCGG